MNNEQLFNILEKLLDELEYQIETNESNSYSGYKALFNYCQSVRQQVFTDKSELSFNVVPKATV